MKVSVCVGSSCHLKGSREVIMRLQELIKEHRLMNQVELCAAFCLGHCAHGVTMMVDDEVVENANGETIDQIFEEKILAKLAK